jgi:hypothetical protein
LTRSQVSHHNDGFCVLPKRIGRQELEVVPIRIFPRRQAGEGTPGAVVSGPEVGQSVDGCLVGLLQSDALDGRGGACVKICELGFRGFRVFKGFRVSAIGIAWTTLEKPQQPLAA